MSKSREQLQEMLKRIDITGLDVLDAGSQDKLSNKYATGTPKSYKTMDIDPQWNPDVLWDLNNQTSQSDMVLRGWQFDAIFCIEVLEHCWDPITALKNLKYMLKPGGTVYISTPFINPHHDVWDYLRYTGEWYEKALTEIGMKVVEVKERVATLGKESLANFYKEEGLKVSKIRPEYGRYTYPIGYFVTAEKKK